MGQDVSPEREPIRIEVTGSNIKRTDAEGPLPVQVITREEIERAGWTTAAELMSHVAANFNGANDWLSIGSGSPGLASANLRGIGGQYTLVMLNGRRLANFAFESFAVDLSTIPFSAIERVEILRDGASSIYGTDAIAGVINFILRKDFRGAEVSVQGAIPQHEGGDQYQATATVGFGDLAKDSYNAFISVDWQKDRGLGAQDRTFGRTGYRPDMGMINIGFGTFPGGIQRWVGDQFLGGVFPSAAAGCAPPLSIRVPEFGDGFCAFDSAAIIDLAPPTESLTAYGRGVLQLAADHQLFAEYSYARRNLQLKVAPGPVSRFTSPTLTPIRYPVGGPFYPTDFAAANGFSGDLDVVFRTLELGPRVDEARTEAQRVLFGAEGRLGGWDYNTAYTHSVDEARDALAHGFVSTSRLAAAMTTGLINPFGASGDEGRRLLATTELAGESRNAKGTLDQIDFRASTQWGRLAGGPIGFAAGADARRERLDDRPAPSEIIGDLAGDLVKLSPQHGSRRAQALFVEANLPFLTSLETQLSARYDHYSDFGGTTNPKIALRWQPVRELLFRGAWGTGFRAPTLVDLHGLQTESFTEPLNDPLRCDVTHSALDCTVAFRTITGGNASLKPERSTQYTLGAVWEPVPTASASIQYWHIELRDAVASLNPGQILENIGVFGASNVLRGPVDPAHPTLPGPIQHIIVYQQNVGRLETAGFDFDAQARSPMLAFGRVSARLDGSYITKSEQHLTGLSPESTLGKIGVLGPVPRWRHYLALDWERGPWTSTLAQTFQLGYTDAHPLPDDTLRRVGSYSVWDAQVGFSGVRNLKVTVGVKNLFDRDPPFSNGGLHGYDPAYADPRGRTYYARLTYAFE
jgi:iron complex outermembrane receptor protein